MRNVSEAFTFPFKDPKWIEKFLVGALFAFLSFLLIGIPVLYGYYIELLRRVQRNESTPLPEWKDPGIKFITGIKYIALLIIYVLPLMAIIIPLALLSVMTVFMNPNTDALLGSFILTAAIFIVIVPYIVFILLLTPVITIEFAQNESIGEGLRISRILKYFKFLWPDVLTAVLISVALDILASVGILFFLIGLLFTLFYVSLVKFHLYGQIGSSIITQREPV